MWVLWRLEEYRPKIQYGKWYIEALERAQGSLAENKRQILRRAPKL